MELKAYQKNVLDDLQRYLELMNETQNYREAFRRFWAEESAPSLGFYRDVTPGVPNVCFKVPTGGGKTFIACAAIRPLFDALPPIKTKAVVWLVPSDAILTQTLKALKDPNHPYRRRLAVDFGNRFEVYSKQELLNGQNFNPTTVFEGLSIMVLSYDSFRGRGKDALKAYQENGALAEFAKIFGAADAPIPNADETSLFQAINRLNPVVIVDESHHARTELSLEMLKNFNPSFVLDLTATPRKESNIVSYVDAVRLKSENMVKLPVVLYNRDSQADVLIDALDLRRRLEELAAAEFERSGRYVRPIALFQAQPKGKEDATTFEKLRDKLIEAGVPASEIAIRTADVDELKGVDLTSPECAIRCIITVNALKEGWDCPFAYVLASLANKTSQIDVEQILGRVLRLPHARRNGAAALNMSYVLTSSNDFEATARQIVRGLNGAGFSERDYRLASSDDVAPQQTTQPLLPQFETSSDESDDLASLDGAAIASELKRRREAQEKGDAPSAVDALLNDAESLAEVYETEIGVENENEEAQEVKAAKKSFNVNPQFYKDLEEPLPQFCVKFESSSSPNGVFELLDRAALSEGFMLDDESSEIDFDSADAEIVEVDVRETEGGMPKVFKMSNADQRAFQKYFAALPSEKRRSECREIVFRQLNKNNALSAYELKNYLDRIIAGLDRTQLDALEQSPHGFAEKIKARIETLLNRHRRQTFAKWLETERVVCRPFFHLPWAISPASASNAFGRSLYSAEEETNKLEADLILELTALDNIRWWHRNIARKGFAINGFIDHYPDFIVKTNSGKTILVETKGEHLKNDDSQAKLELGLQWSKAAGPNYRYYMVFRDEENLMDGAKSIKQFLEIVRDL